MRKRRISLKMGLLTTIVICWLVPMVIVVALAGILLERNARQAMQQEIDVTAQNSIGQVQMRLQDAVEKSKAVSYDGIVRSAYREYLREGKAVQLYRTVNDYLNQNFSRDEKFKAVYIRFWNDSVPQPYIISNTAAGFEVRQSFGKSVEKILEVMHDADTEIRFLYLEGEIYMARNLLDSSFTAYATVVMMLETDYMFGALEALDMVEEMHISLGDCHLLVGRSGSLILPEKEPEAGNRMEYTVDVDDHKLTVTVWTDEYDVWESNPWLRLAILAVSLLMLPLLVIVVALFSHHVSRPMQTLAQAYFWVQSGERGYQIVKRPPNAEFEKLYMHFNLMSTELKKQFERSFLEQQATQRAQIKALQSQINPHFLNNTLEIINWEARIAENDRVSAMIEALSTMLDAALDRDGRTQIPLREELGYVDAYLYIIQERLGDGFYVNKDIDRSVLEQAVPRLILQPIVENAVEHDITERRGGNLWVRAYRRENMMVLEVEHDGSMSTEDEKKIQRLLSDENQEVSRVGLRNVHQRLKLMYGEAASLNMEQTSAGTVRARIQFPAG